MLRALGTISGIVAVFLAASCTPPTIEEQNETFGTIDRVATVAQFNPAWSDACTGETGTILPLPINLAFIGSDDGTLALETDDPTDEADPFNALGSLDGWSTNAPISFTFSAPVDASTVVGNQGLGGPTPTVRVFKIRLSQVYPFPTSARIDPTDPPTELVEGVDYEIRVKRIEETYNDATDNCVSKVREKDGVDIVPLHALEPATSYLVAVTNGVIDAEGYPIDSDAIYRIAQGRGALSDKYGNTKMEFIPPLRDDATAVTLDGLRAMTNTFEILLGLGRGVSGMVLTFAFTTQGIDAGLAHTSAHTASQPYTLGPAMDADQNAITTCFLNGYDDDTGEILCDQPGLNFAGTGDIYLGSVDLPQYIGQDPSKGYWRLGDGSALTRFTNDMTDSEEPKVERTETAPMLMVLPNAKSGFSRPATGWPVAIFQHTITQNRGNLLAFVEALTNKGIAAVAIDLPLHGVEQYAGGDPVGGVNQFFPIAVDAPATTEVDGEDVAYGLYKNLPWFAGAPNLEERHNYDLVKNVLPAAAGGPCQNKAENADCTVPGEGGDNQEYAGKCRWAADKPLLQCAICDSGNPDGLTDASGKHFFNPAVMMRTRDNFRQGVVDLMTLRKSLDTMTIQGAWSGQAEPVTPEFLFDSSNVSFIGHGLGGALGTVLLATDKTIKAGVLVSPVGGIARAFEASGVIGTALANGLSCNDVVKGIPLYDTFYWALQTVLDSADPINYAGSVTQPILAMEVVGHESYSTYGIKFFGPDNVFPNSANGNPLAGTSPLAEAMGLTGISADATDAAGLKSWVRFMAADHTTFLSPLIRCEAVEAELSTLLGQPSSVVECYADAAAAREEMHNQMATFLSSGGTSVEVNTTANYSGYNVEIVAPAATP